MIESKTKYLENRLEELNRDLDNTEIKINLKKKEQQDKINQLQNDLKLKKEELEKQSLLQEKVQAFENRLIQTEKLNSQELELDSQIDKIKNKIRTTSENILNHNKVIEEKTNYLEKKISSYNGSEIVNTNDNYTKDRIQTDKKSEVVNINKNINKNLNKLSKKSQNEEEENKKIKKLKFFSPNFFK